FYRHPLSTLFPYTTLFRSLEPFSEHGKRLVNLLFHRWGIFFLLLGFLLGRASIVGELAPFALPFFAVIYHLRRDRLLFVGFFIRSEEHTSELQSRENLVCR